MCEEFLKKLGCLIQELRLARNMDIKEFAKKAKTNNKRVANIENAKVAAKIYEIENIAKALDISALELLKRADDI